MDVQKQVAELMAGSEFSDRMLYETMHKELTERLEESTKTGVPLRVYAGYDATAPDLHLGHSITLRKLRLFQEYGHKVFFLVGTFTSLVGDTSDKATARPAKRREEVESAARTYAEQCFRILDREKTEVVYNADWLADLTLTDVTRLASTFTVQQFLARDNYRLRIEKGDAVGLHEFLYALLQGYDAVHLKADVQIGATEQLFNILAGRKLQASFGQRPCTCITYPILLGTDGVERMSKSKGNYIGLSEPPEAQYVKIMRLSDETMKQFIPLVTRWPQEEVTGILSGLRDGTLHPLDMKKRLAFEIVSMYHGDSAAQEAQQGFEALCQKREVPEDIPEYVLHGPESLVGILVATGSVGSKGEARRLILGRGVKIDGEVVSDARLIVDQAGSLVQMGKHKFVRIIEPGA